MNLRKTKDNYGTINLHEGHRERLRKNLTLTKFVDADDYKNLEYLLTLVIKRKDTNELAHELVNNFGSLAKVLDSDEDSLMSIKGVTPTIANFLSSLPYIFRNYSLSKTKGKPIINTPKDIFDYVGHAIAHLPNEEFYIICLDNSNKVIERKNFAQGNSSVVALEIAECLKYAINLKARKVILVHNHPTSSPDPSVDDMKTTKQMFFNFSLAGIELFDHMIVNYEGKFYSFAQEAQLQKYKADFEKAMIIKPD